MERSGKVVKSWTGRSGRCLGSSPQNMFQHVIEEPLIKRLRRFRISLDLSSRHGFVQCSGLKWHPSCNIAAAADFTGGLLIMNVDSKKEHVFFNTLVKYRKRVDVRFDVRDGSGIRPFQLNAGKSIPTEVSLFSIGHVESEGQQGTDSNVVNLKMTNDGRLENAVVYVPETMNVHGFRDGVECLDIDPVAGSFVLVGEASRHLSVVDPRAGPHPVQTTSHCLDDAAKSLHISPRNERIVLTIGQYQLSILDLRMLDGKSRTAPVFELHRPLPEHPDPALIPCFTAGAFSKQDGGLFAITDNHANLRIFSSTNFQLEHTVTMADLNFATRHPNYLMSEDDILITEPSWHPLVDVVACGSIGTTDPILDGVPAIHFVCGRTGTEINGYSRKHLPMFANVRFCEFNSAGNQILAQGMRMIGANPASYAGTIVRLVDEQQFTELEAPAYGSR